MLKKMKKTKSKIKLPFFWLFTWDFNPWWREVKGREIQVRYTRIRESIFKNVFMGPKGLHLALKWLTRTKTDVCRVAMACWHWNKAYTVRFKKRTHYNNNYKKFPRKLTKLLEVWHTRLSESIFNKLSIINKKMILKKKCRILMLLFVSIIVLCII